MPNFEPATPEQERVLVALKRQNLLRRRFLLNIITSRAAIDFVASLRSALMAQGYEVERLLADWIEVEAGAIRRHANAQRIFHWATRRTRRTLNFLGRN